MAATASHTFVAPSVHAPTSVHPSAASTSQPAALAPAYPAGAPIHDPSSPSAPAHMAAGGTLLSDAVAAIAMEDVGAALPSTRQDALQPGQTDLGEEAEAAARAAAHSAIAEAALAPPPAETGEQTVAAKDKEKKEPRRIRFAVGSKYKVQDVIGEGAYGVVCSAVHVPSGQRVAIKKIAPFDHSMFALRTLRELKLLRFFAEHQVSENLITVIDLIKPSSYDSFKEVYLIQELMETDLYRVIRTQTLSDDHVQYFIYQTLRALKALHSANIIHRDLKPSNLLLNANCDLKVCDFGLARSVMTAEPNGGETGFMTEYVATRWYRAPEIMLTFRMYTKAVDIWSVGCICAEMLSGRPLFPGRDYHHQLTLILSVTGTPTIDEFYRINSRRSRDYLRALPFQKRRSFAELFPNASPLAVDFLARTLTFDPIKRLTVEQALEHPYLSQYHDPEDEPCAPPLEPDFFDFDLQKLGREDLKRRMYDEVMAFEPLV
ncbi:mitogen-activated protein kinase [Rhodotorula paludigena]|uniref:mitogen-activated protein kinase n=1 Tax=Rhodotorula paludigena TaxID=86838 RepID=UPI003172DD4E